MDNPNGIRRRDFLKLTGLVLGGAYLIGSADKLLAFLQTEAIPQSRLDFITSPNETIVPTVCLLCPSGCGMLARVADGNLVKLEGNPMHPINLGALCPKGQAAPELIYNPDRITGPMRRTGARGSGQWEPITWDDAVSMVADRLVELRASGHPERSAILYGETRGQMRAFLEYFMAVVGSPNTVSHDSLNIEAAKLGVLLTQGVYDMPVYDLENTRYVVSFGASLLEGGRHVQRMVSGYSFMRRGRADRGKVVVFDPRQGVSGAKADEWIPIKPGTDAALALGIANVIIRSSQFDSDFVKNYSFGFDDFVDDEGNLHRGFKSYVLNNFDLQRVEQITGVPATTISRIAGEFAGNQPAVAILPGKGGLLNGSFNGVAAAMAIHSLNALVGNIDKPGGVLTQRYFPCADWPSLPRDAVARQGRQAERVDGAGTTFPVGRHAYQAVAERVLGGYPLDLLFLYDANPVYETPGGERFIQAFERVPMIVSFATFLDETAQFADLVLPEPTFLERWQDDFTEGLGYPGVGLRQPVVQPLYDTLNSGDFLLRVAHAMGEPVADAFPWDSFKEVVQHRLQNIGVEWDLVEELGVWTIPGYYYSRRGSRRWVQEVIGKDRSLSPRDGRFDFFSRELACLINRAADLDLPVPKDEFFLPHYEPVEFIGDEKEFPFTLNVVTLMSLGPYSYAANMPSLQEISGMTVGERWTSWLEMNPESAEHLGLHDKQEVWVESAFGKLKTKLRLVEALHPDVVNLPYNLGHTAVGRWARNRGVNGLQILNPASEPLSGLAAFTNTKVKVYPA